MDTTSSHLQQVGETLQSLVHLNLNDSIIYNIRDLGTSFRNIEVLWINRCDLKDLSGMVALDNLRELYCGYNEISDLYDLSNLDKLTVLDLEANQITDIENIRYLKNCFDLTDLNVEWNPVNKSEKEIIGILP